MTRRILMACAVVAAAGPVLCRESHPPGAGVLAWVQFEKAPYRHAGRPYLWLGHGPITLTIDVKPDASHVLELLWGCKNDTRDGVAVVCGQEVPLSGSGYDGSGG